MPVTVTKGASAPPVKANANKTTAKAAPAKEMTVTEARTAAVAQLGQLAQLPLMFTKNYADMGAIALHWPNVAGEIAKLADTNEQIAKLVDPLMQVGPYAGLIGATLPLLVQVAVNHKRVQPGAMNSVPPSTLSAQIEAGLAETELQALQLQADAERKSAEMRNSIAAQRKALADAMRDQQGATTND